jgi:hypothetical protein
MKGYRLHELKQAPEGPGIYSWYYAQELSDRDIEDAIGDVVAFADPEGRAAMIESFLGRHLFRYYREAPYDVSVSGAMKPRYAGRIDHQAPISSTLVTRLAENPERLRGLKQLLRSAVPQFASPIYIGVAGSLRQRLLRHKALIEKFSNARSLDDLTPPPADQPEDAIVHSFAREVCVDRRMIAPNLIVYAMECQVDPDLRYDLENLLNRINYPLCGRN